MHNRELLYHSHVCDILSTVRYEIFLSEERQAQYGLTPSNRCAEDYLKLLSLELSDLSGKRILDLGSGQDARFARDIHALSPQTKVVSLDQSFLTHHPENASADDDLPLVGGYFGALPLEDASFDMILSSFAFPLYTEGQDCMQRALSEILRILCPGGTARFAPMVFHRRWSTQHVQPDNISDAELSQSTFLEEVPYHAHDPLWTHLLQSLCGTANWHVLPIDPSLIAAPYNHLLLIRKHC